MVVPVELLFSILNFIRNWFTTRLIDGLAIKGVSGHRLVVFCPG